jgi:hypothetical protein
VAGGASVASAGGASDSAAARRGRGRRGRVGGWCCGVVGLRDGPALRGQRGVRAGGGREEREETENREEGTGRF